MKHTYWSYKPALTLKQAPHIRNFAGSPVSPLALSPARCIAQALEGGFVDAHWSIGVVLRITATAGDSGDAGDGGDSGCGIDLREIW